MNPLKMNPMIRTSAVVVTMVLAALLVGSLPSAAAETPVGPMEIPCVNVSPDPPEVTIDPDCIGAPPPPLPPG